MILKLFCETNTWSAPAPRMDDDLSDLSELKNVIFEVADRRLSWMRLDIRSAQPERLLRPWSSCKKQKSKLNFGFYIQIYYWFLTVLDKYFLMVWVKNGISKTINYFKQWYERTTTYSNFLFMKFVLKK